MKHRNIAFGALPISEWEAEISDDNVRTSWNWLLAYEAIRLGWLPDRHGLMTKSFFEPMAKRDVAFFDPKRNVFVSRRYITDRRKVRRRDMLEVNAMIQMLRGIDLDLY